MEWLQGKHGQAKRVWHKVVGRYGEGDQTVIKTRCYPYGHYLEKDTNVVEADQAPGPVCVACSRVKKKA